MKIKLLSVIICYLACSIGLFAQNRVPNGVYIMRLKTDRKAVLNKTISVL